ncbi:uncharacterized protein LOC107759690 [Nicotiana tabacum]|uniref:Uncharacterized protein LOC107759690 n=1 Tax=Nicotiana tabacum TaxID=4097 RepID=A0AC58SRU5_TOBAC
MVLWSLALRGNCSQGELVLQMGNLLHILKVLKNNKYQVRHKFQQSESKRRQEEQMDISSLADYSSQLLTADLKEKFDKRNILRIYNLLQEIAGFKQGLSPVSTYYSKLKDLWDEYDAMAPTPSCPRPESKVFLEHIQHQRLVQFLSRLNESFGRAKGQIMLMIPTPTINEAYGMVVQDESQRAKTMNINGLEMGAAAVAYNSGQGFPGGYKQKAQVDYSKGPTGQGSPGVATSGNFFTEEQYKQLLQLLNQNTTPVEIAAHAKDTCIPLSLLSRVQQDKWIIDSGATNHMVSSLDFFTDFINIPKGESRKVQLPTGETSRIMHLGSSNILNGVQIKNVIYVPQFRYNLLSVSQLTRDIGCFIAFFPAWCVFQDICNGKVKGIGKLEKGLYVLDLKHKSNPKLPIGVITSALVMNRISSYLWHKILGHIPLDALKRLPVFHNKTFIDCNEHCPVCPLAKKTRLPFPISSSRCDVFGDLIHANIWGPFKVPTFDAPVYDSDFDDLVLPLPHHSTTSQDTPSSDLEHLDDSVVVTPPHIPLTEDLQGSSTSHTTMLPFPDDLPSSPTNHITPIPFTYALLSYVDDDLTADGIRKSTRPSRPPIWTNDYVVRQTAGKSKPCNYPIANSISYQALKHAYSQCLAAYSAEIEPSSFS